MIAEQIMAPGGDREDRSRWLALRRTGIGGSDVSAILGLSKYRCARDVFYDKTEGFDQEPNEAMHWGHLLEPVVRDEWTRRTGISVTPAGLHRNIARPIMLQSPDGLTGDGGLYEGKVARNETDWADEQLPDHAELQVQHGMAVMGLPHAWVVACLAGQRLVWRRVQRDDELIEMLIKEEERFWNDHVLTGEPPPLDGSEAAVKAVTNRYPTSTGAVLRMERAEAERLRRNYREAKAREALDAEAVTAAQNAIRDALGWHEVAMVGSDEYFTWKNNGSKFDEAGFRAAHPDLAERYTVDVPQLDLKALAKAEPEIFRRFKNRVLRVKGS